MPLILILLGLLGFVFIAWPSYWIIGISSLVMLLVGAFGMVMSK